MQGKKAMTRIDGREYARLVSSRLVSSRLVGQSVVLFVYLGKQVQDIICLIKIVLNVDVDRRNSQLKELVLEGS